MEAVTKLDVLLKESGVPIQGVSLKCSAGRNYTIFFEPTATNEQKAKAYQIADAFDWKNTVDASCPTLLKLVRELTPEQITELKKILTL